MAAINLVAITIKFMWKYCFLIIIFFMASCRSYKMLEGKAAIVSFSADSALFDTSLSHRPTLGYSDLYGLNFTMVDLQKAKETKIPISYPAFFIRNSLYLVFPGEKIEIKLDDKEDYVMAIPKNAQRSRELAFMNNFIYSEMELHDSLKSAYLHADKKTMAHSLMLTLQHHNSAKMMRLNTNAAQQNLSEKFKNISRLYFAAEPLNKLIGFYVSIADSFNNKEEYLSTLKTLLPVVNQIMNIDQIIYGHANDLSNLADAILPTAIWKINSQIDFQTSFDTSITFFSGVSRDFIMAKIVYSAYKNRVPIQAEYLAKFYKMCQTPQYAMIIKNLINQQQHIRKKITDSNSLLGEKNKKITDLETLLAQQKGKLVLLDFWASWCQPCIAEIPALQKLQEAYAGRGLQILNISFDKEIQKWKKFIIAHNLTKSTNFIFANAKESDFVIKNRIEEIPRYMLISRDGMIITSDAPSPSDPALRELIDKNL